MTIYSNVVIHNPVSKKHVPVVPGDKLAGSLLQLSTDAGNSIALGTDGGLKVSIPAQLPDDQVLTGDNSGSVNLTLTPSTQPNGDVNYTIKGEVKIDPAAGNAAVATAAGVYVPTPTVPTYTTGNAPTVVDDGTTTTQYFGGNSIALGNPVGWEKRVGTTKVYPVYDEGSVSGGATSVSGKQVAYGTIPEVPWDGSKIKNTVTVMFTTDFPSSPFVTPVIATIGQNTGDAMGVSVVATSNKFTLQRAAVTVAGKVVYPAIEWKAEEK